MFSRISSRTTTANFRPIKKHGGMIKNFMPKRMFSNDVTAKPTLSFACKTALFVIPMVGVPLTWVAYDDYTTKEWVRKKLEKEKKEKDEFDAELICKEDDNIQTKIAIGQIKLDMELFTIMKNKTEQICLSVVKRRPDYIIYIENPSEAVCLQALKLKPSLINRIKNPTTAMFMCAIEQKPQLIEELDKKYITNDLVMKAVEQNLSFEKYNYSDTLTPFDYVSKEHYSSFMKYFKNPSEELCWKMIRRDPDCIRYIQKDCVTEEMKLVAVNSGVLNINHYTDKCPCDRYAMCKYHKSKLVRSYDFDDDYYY
jgi:hypothetical protein